MKLKIISGGQTGADQAGLRAAVACGLKTGGWAPKGWITEDGPASELLKRYNLVECPYSGYPSRTQSNVEDADLVLWIGDCQSPGGKLTLQLAQDFRRDVYCALPGVTDPAEIVRWFQKVTTGKKGRVTLMVAGNRESKAIGIGETAEKLCWDVFKLLKKAGAVK